MDALVKDMAEYERAIKLLGKLSQRAEDGSKKAELLADKLRLKALATSLEDARKVLRLNWFEYEDAAKLTA